MEVKSKLIDHLVVMGVSQDKEKITLKAIQNNTIVPTLLEIYPTPTGQTSIPRYFENFHLWTFENGFKIYDENCRTIYGKEDKFLAKSSLNQKNGASEGIESKNRVYSFVMTDERSCKRYCSSLLFHEACSLGTDDKGNQLDPRLALIYVPKSITVVSTTPCFEAQRRLLKHVYGDLLQAKNKEYCSRNIKIPNRYVWNLASVIKEVQTKASEGGETSVDRQWEKKADYNREEHFNEAILDEGPVLNETGLREFYISAIFSLMDIPVKPTEKVVLKLYNEENSAEFVRYRSISKIGMYYPQVNYRLLFKRLSARNIVRVFKYVLLEKQIIFFSSKPEEIPCVTEAFLSLIAPLSWCCLYVPFVPIVMWEILHAVMPYIVGVCSKYKEFVAHQIDLTDKIVVDLDDDALFIGEDLCEFPKEPMDFLIKKLDEISQLCRKSNQKMSKRFWMEITLKARESLNIGLLAIMNNYLAFFKPSRRIQINKASEIFVLNEYFGQFRKQHIPFMREFSRTMIFTNLIEESYRLVYSDKNNSNDIPPDNIHEISHFIEQLKEVIAFSYSDLELFNEHSTFLNLLHPKAIEHIEMVNSDSVKQVIQRHSSADLVDLFPYLVKYYFRFFLSQKDRIKLLSSSPPVKSNEQPSILSPVNLQSSNPVSTQDIKTYIPLDKSKIVDLNKVFQAAFSLVQSPTYPVYNKPTQLPPSFTSSDPKLPVGLDKSSPSKGKNFDNFLMTSPELPPRVSRLEGSDSKNQWSGSDSKSPNGKNLIFRKRTEDMDVNGLKQEVKTFYQKVGSDKDLQEPNGNKVLMKKKTEEEKGSEGKKKIFENKEKYIAKINEKNQEKEERENGGKSLMFDDLESKKVMEGENFE